MHEILVGALGGLMGMVLMRWFMATSAGRRFAAWMDQSVKVTTTVIRIDPDHFPNYFKTGK